MFFLCQIYNIMEFSTVNIHGGSHCFIKAKIEGIDTTLLLDTGSSNSALDKKFIHDNNLKMEKSEFPIIGYNSIDVSGMRTKATMNIDNNTNETIFEVLCLDYMNKIYSDNNIKPIDGIFGCDMMNRYKATIDFRNNSIILNG